MSRPYVQSRNRKALLAARASLSSCASPQGESQDPVIATPSSSLQATPPVIAKSEATRQPNPLSPRVGNPAFTDIDQFFQRRIKPDYYGMWDNDPHNTYIGTYTLSSRLQTLVGGIQASNLRFILPKSIPIRVKAQGRDAVVQWAIEEKGYILPDLKALEYIYEHSEEFPFDSLRRRSSKLQGRGLWLYFAGTTIWQDPENSRYPCLQWGRGGIGYAPQHWSGHFPWDETDILAILTS